MHLTSITSPHPHSPRSGTIVRTIFLPTASLPPPCYPEARSSLFFPLALGDEIMTRPEFDLLYPCSRTKSDLAISINKENITSRPSATATTNNHVAYKPNEDNHQDDDDGELLLEAYVHRSRSEELEKRLNLQQSTHFSAAADLQARITSLESQLDKHTTASCQKDIEIARERDRSKDLTEEMAQLRTASDACHTQLRIIGNTNDGLRTELNIKENGISDLSAELSTLRKDYATREQALVSKVSSLDQALADLRVQLERSRAEMNTSSLSLSQTKEEMRLAKEIEALAKERLVNTEKECADKIASIIQRETDAIAAATSDLEARLQIAEERTRVAEEREENANAVRRKAETEAADLRNQFEENLFRAKECAKEDYEKLLQSKDDELAGINKFREADALQMDDLRQALASQETNHKSELVSHSAKIEEMSRDLHVARRDLDSERKSSSDLKIDLGKAQTRLDGVTRQGQEDERAGEQKKDLLEHEVSLLKEELSMQKASHKEEIANYATQIRQGRAREVELEGRVIENENRYRAECKDTEKKIEDAIRSIFTE